VIVSRGELIEIGDGFRIPDIMAHSGAKLVEVGTTNRTRIEDYRAALTPRTRALLRVHPSNFRMEGFTGRPALSELAALGRERSVPVYEDLGSGCLRDLADWGVAEPTIAQSLKAGVSVVSFSGDKLLGGPQAGIIAGDRALVERARRNPMFRALRLDKLQVAALETTLRHLVWEEWDAVPALRMLRLSADAIRTRAEALALGCPGATVVPGESLLGGGSTPEQTLPAWLLRLPGGANEWEGRLRRHEPPVIARIADDACVLDLRTVRPEEDAVVAAALAAAGGGAS
jgi:L-seryl-tRNA(Ser) seleniumtransferase